MDASDYMTEKVQRFAVHGDLKYIQAYYNEAFLNQRREEALNTMASDAESAEALEKLQAAMDGSEELMEQEYYAMRLVVEAKGYNNAPLSLKDVELSKEDEALSAEGKIDRAREIVFGNDYYAKKSLICIYAKKIHYKNIQLSRKRRNKTKKTNFVNFLYTSIFMNSLSFCLPSNKNTKRSSWCKWS